MRPSLPSVNLSRRTKIVLAVIVILIVLIILLVKFCGIYINYLWYGSLGHRNVYSTILWTKVALFFIFGTLMAVIIGGNLVAAYGFRPPFRHMSPEQQSLQNYVLMVEPRRRWVLAGVMIIAFLAAGASAQGDWAAWQLWLHGGSFGVRDPLFHMDISFYAFDYPVYRILLSFGFTAVIFSLILSVAVHYLSGAIRIQTPGPKITLAARRQITILVFAFMILKAIAYWLDRYGLVFSSRSKFTGASYTDVHSLLPAKTILFWITIILAIGVLASMWTRSALLPGIGFVVLLVLSILITGIYPAAIQRYSVKPNASTKEAPYIADNIAATRQAYGIVTEDAKHPDGTVKYVNYPAISSPSTDALSEQNTTIDNIRILDPNVISPTFTNFQKLGLPYGFSNTLDMDRYTLTDPATKKKVEHDYVVGVREQVPGSNLTGSQNNWINQHTVYTHGYGFVAAEADKDVTSGKVPYTEGEIPPTGPLGLTQPDVYFGEGGNDYSIVGAQGTPREFDANAGNYVSYRGKGGVSLSNFFTRFAFAVKYKETNFLLNNLVSASGAKIIFNRDPKTMLQKVAPFLTVDGDPYPFVDSSTGHIMWMLDGYTTMANYPYSERQSLSDLTHTSLRQGQKDTQINYIRNSVKATVDAYDGTITLYAWDPTDPLLKAWMSVFPGLVKPASDMPASVRAHVRYPQDLFDVQRGLLAQYHITDPVAWYNGRGKWQVPEDPNGNTGANQPSYYVLANPPTAQSNTAQPEFQLTSPMVVPGGSNNLAAYLSVNSDPGKDYGKLTVLQVPGKAVVQGPSQVATYFHTKALVAKDITQLSGQSSVIKGNLLTLPLGNSFLYVEPVYVESNSASSSNYPTLQRILVAYGDNIGYDETLQAAISDVIAGIEPGSSIPIGGGQTSTPPTKPTPTPTTGSTSSTPPPTSSSTPPKVPTGEPTSVQQALQQLAAVQAQLNATTGGNLQKIFQLSQRQNQLVADLLRLEGKTPAKPGAKATPTP